MTLTLEDLMFENNDAANAKGNDLDNEVAEFLRDSLMAEDPSPNVIFRAGLRLLTWIAQSPFKAVLISHLKPWLRAHWGRHPTDSALSSCIRLQRPHRPSRRCSRANSKTNRSPPASLWSLRLPSARDSAQNFARTWSVCVWSMVGGPDVTGDRGTRGSGTPGTVQPREGQAEGSWAVSRETVGTNAHAPQRARNRSPEARGSAPETRTGRRPKVSKRVTAYLSVAACVACGFDAREASAPAGQAKAQLRTRRPRRASIHLRVRATGSPIRVATPPMRTPYASTNDCWRASSHSRVNEGAIRLTQNQSTRVTGSRCGATIVVDYDGLQRAKGGLLDTEMGRGTKDCCRGGKANQHSRLICECSEPSTLELPRADIGRDTGDKRPATENDPDGDRSSH